MKRFIYKVETIEEELPWVLQRRLNEFGKDGWQLIAKHNSITYIFIKEDIKQNNTDNNII